MRDDRFELTSDADGLRVRGYVWSCSVRTRAVCVVAHGAGEHALRYERFAEALGEQGFETWAVDHRGHGQTAGLARLGDYGDGGWDALVADLGQLLRYVRAQRPGLPLALFAHSMGSMAAQDLMPDASDVVDALVLSGSSAPVRPPGASGPPPPLNGMIPLPRTEFDWLSRDPFEVDRYIADPYCGFQRGQMNANTRPNFARMADGERLSRIRSDLPVLLLAGDEDPINRRLDGLHTLERMWREAGVQRIATLFYKGARHELLNETNRDDVTRDVIEWMRSALGL